MSENKNNPAVPTIEELLAKNQALETISLEQQELIESLTDKIKGLETAQESVSSISVQKQSAPKKLVPEKSFKVGGKSYQFVVAQFRKEGTIIKAVDALADPVLLKEIVEDFPNLVKPVK